MKINLGARFLRNVFSPYRALLRNNATSGGGGSWEGKMMGESTPRARMAPAAAASDSFPANAGVVLSESNADGSGAAAVVLQGRVGMVGRWMEESKMPHWAAECGLSDGTECVFKSTRTPRVRFRLLPHPDEVMCRKAAVAAVKEMTKSRSARVAVSSLPQYAAAALKAAGREEMSLPGMCLVQTLVAFIVERLSCAKSSSGGGGSWSQPSPLPGLDVMPLPLPRTERPQQQQRQQPQGRSGSNSDDDDVGHSLPTAGWEDLSLMDEQQHLRYKVEPLTHAAGTGRGSTCTRTPGGVSLSPGNKSRRLRVSNRVAPREENAQGVTPGQGAHGEDGNCGEDGENGENGAGDPTNGPRTGSHIRPEQSVEILCNGSVLSPHVDIATARDSFWTSTSEPLTLHYRTIHGVSNYR